VPFGRLETGKLALGVRPDLPENEINHFQIGETRGRKLAVEEFPDHGSGWTRDEVSVAVTEVSVQTNWTSLWERLCMKRSFIIHNKRLGREAVLSVKPALSCWEGRALAGLFGAWVRLAWGSKTL